MNDPLFSVEDKVTLVSGASRGIGKAIAKGFAGRGARVIITGRDEQTLAAAAEEISVNGNVEPRVCDVASVESVRQTVEQVHQSYGRIDTLVSVAGVNIRQPATEFSEEDYSFVLDINLKGAFFIAQQVGKYMLEQGGGSIINIDSLNTYAPLKNVAPYAISKAGVVMMTRSLAVEWGPAGVRVNTLAPGFVLTDLTRRLWSDPGMLEWGRTNTPLSRLGQVDDMVGTAVFLASDAAAFMTGQVVRVDGGFSAGINWPIPGDGGQ